MKFLKLLINNIDLLLFIAAFLILDITIYVFVNGLIGGIVTAITLAILAVIIEIHGT